VVEQLKPKIVVPMHYYDRAFLLQSFLAGPYKARFLDVKHLQRQQGHTAADTEIYIPKVVWRGRGMTADKALLRRPVLAQGRECACCRSAAIYSLQSMRK